MINLNKEEEQRRVKLILIQAIADPNTILQRVAMYPDQGGLLTINIDYYNDERTTTTQQTGKAKGTKSPGGEKSK